MSAPTLEVRRLHARYRLRGGDERTRARLDRLLSNVAGSGLGAALVRLGVGSEEEICIRSVRAPVRLTLAASDDAICAAWSSVIVAAIDAAASGGGRDVIRYPSRRHAVVDLVGSVAGGDYARSWAWRRLGLWAVGEEPSGADAAEALVDALCSDPAAIVPALVSVARAGSLVPLLTLLDEPGWARLAATALAAAGASADLGRIVAAGTELTGHPGPTPAHDPAASTTSALSEPSNSLLLGHEGAGESVLRRSEIARATLESRPAGLRESTIVSVATLSVLEDDPAVVASAVRAARAIAAVAAVLRPGLTGRGVAPDPSGAETAADDATSKTSEPAGAAPSNGLLEGDPKSGALAEGNADGDLHGQGARGPRGAPDAAETTRADEPATHRAAETAFPRDAPASEPDAPPDQPDAALRYSTRFAGLLFLLPLVAELGLPARPPAALAERRLRWVLHQLALVLQPLEPDDPAALAFAGLPPDAELPTAAEEPPTIEERLALADTGDALVELLRVVLAEPHRPPDELLDFVCRRRAEVVGDPGWVELRFRLDDVSIELRRVGLDLDPGWVPWLGAVVRFVYV